MTPAAMRADASVCRSPPSVLRTDRRLAMFGIDCDNECADASLLTAVD